MAVEDRELSQEVAGLDSLELQDPRSSGTSQGRRIWTAVWPKVAAIAIGLALWQALVWSHWKPSYVLPAPGPVFRSLGRDAQTAIFWRAIGTSMRRALVGYALAVAVGLVVGGLVARSAILRSAVGSLITGLQTMPSVAWFPLAIVLFKLSEGAITFVVILGAAPSIANGLVTGVAQVPPLLLRSGQMLGARGFRAWRHVVIPAALPSLVGGLKQGWAFAWRSLMAGELLVIIAHRPSIGERLADAQNFNNQVGLIEWMVVILILGLVVDSLFTRADRSLLRRFGLLAPAD